MHAKPDLRVFLKWRIAGSGSVIPAVILLEICQDWIAFFEWFLVRPNLFGLPMFDNEKQKRKLELTRSINRLVFRLCFAAAIVAGIFLILFRISGYLPSDEYSNTHILIQIISVGVVFPICLTTAFRLTAMPGMQIWFERLGALILFVFFPVMIFMAIFQWFTN